VTVEVNAESHLETGAAVTVRNSPKFRLPETGGVGTTVFTLLGLGMMGAAVGLYALSHRKKEA
jgi:LPXTG-motif cell wall-anchored protein